MPKRASGVTLDNRTVPPLTVQAMRPRASQGPRAQAARLDAHRPTTLRSRPRNYLPRPSTMNLFWRHKEKTVKERIEEAERLGVIVPMREVEVGDLQDDFKVIDDPELQKRIRAAHEAQQNTKLNSLKIIWIIVLLTGTIVGAAGTAWSHRTELEAALLQILRRL